MGHSRDVQEANNAPPLARKTIPLLTTAFGVTGQRHRQVAVISFGPAFQGLSPLTTDGRPFRPARCHTHFPQDRQDPTRLWGAFPGAGRCVVRRVSADFPGNTQYVGSALGCSEPCQVILLFEFAQISIKILACVVSCVSHGQAMCAAGGPRGIDGR